MSAPDSRTALRATTAAVIVIAAALTIHAVDTLRDCSGKLGECVKNSAELRDAEREAARGAAAIKMFEALPDPHPVPLATLLKTSIAGDKFEIVERPAEPTIEGWQSLRRDVSLSEIHLSKLGAFLAVVETQRPPWRLVSCRIFSPGAQGGTGRAFLSFNALEKTE